MKRFLVIIGALAMVGAFAATTMAADWSFYGSARMATFYTTMSKEMTTAGLYDSSDLTWAQQGNSRIGANVKAGDVTGRFEYGTGVNLRILYGEWNFGSGKLLLGQTYTPSAIFISNQVFGTDNDLLQVGEPYDGRQPMIRLSFNNFKIAFIKPNISSSAPAYGTYSDTSVTLPKIEASYDFSTDMFWLHPYGVYQTYDMKDPATDASKSIASYVLGIGAGVTVGPAELKAVAYMGQNMGNAGFTFDDAAYLLNGYAQAGTTDIADCDSMGGAFVATFKINDSVSAEGGIGYVHQEAKDDATGVKAEQDVMAYYANMPITFAPGVFIVPEVGYFDYGKAKVTGVADTEMGNQVYFGAKWQINF